MYLRPMPGRQNAALHSTDSRFASWYITQSSMTWRLGLSAASVTVMVLEVGVQPNER